jgi:hypothetical protein
MIGACAHCTLQFAALPVSVSRVHALLSLHEAGQFPSHRSGDSTTPLPHVAEQSSSFRALHASLQQPSPFAQAVISGFWQVTSQSKERPVRTSPVQELASLHLTGQFPSQVSPSSTTPLPQTAMQSVSDPASHRAGQQPSPFEHDVFGALVHSAWQPPVPIGMSIVQAIPSSHEIGQAPGWPGSISVSQSSSQLTMPSPQTPGAASPGMSPAASGSRAPPGQPKRKSANARVVAPWREEKRCMDPRDTARRHPTTNVPICRAPR